MTRSGKILLALFVLATTLSLAPDDAEARRGRSLLGAMMAPLRAVGSAIAPRRFGMRSWYYRKGKYARGPRRAVIVQRRAPAAVPVAAGAVGAAGAAAAAAGTNAAQAPAPGPDDTPSSGQLAATTPQLPDPPPLRSPLRQPQAQQPAPRPQPPSASGWRGPLYWPYASDDLFDYAFQPASADWFWARGGGDLIDAVVMRADDRSDGWADMCGSRRGGSTAWIEPITQALDPTEPQARALDQLREALVQASNGVKIACPSVDTPANPVQRLQQMTDRVWTLRHAITTIRPALETFVAALDESQRAKLNAMGARARDTTASVNASPAAGAQLCADPSVMAAWPGGPIEARVRPSAQQREALRTVQMTTLGMAQFLMGSCPAELPGTLLARLDVAEKRLNALLYAVRNLSPAVAGFYGTLTQEQRMALHTLGQGRPGAAGDARGGPRGNPAEREGRAR